MKSYQKLSLDLVDLAETAGYSSNEFVQALLLTLYALTASVDDRSTLREPLEELLKLCDRAPTAPAGTTH